MTKVSQKSNLNIIQTYFQHKDLIKQLVKREVFSRYKGSFLGIMWSFINPVFMLIIYTFVFGVVFSARWNMDISDKSHFALVLFCGLMVYNIFADVIVRSPNLVVGNVNYVKKVIFPLEILPLVVLLSAIVHFLISLVILILALLILKSVVNWTIILVPIVLIPIFLLSLGIGLFLSSLGVFIRDISQITNVIVSALLFLSPIFYPISAVPSNIRFIYYINPISYVVEDMRNIVLWGILPNWNWLIIGTITGMIIFTMGSLWFYKTKGGFADVL